MGDAEKIASEMRLWALEVLVANMFVMLAALDSDPGAVYRQVRKAMIDGAKQKSFPGFGAAMSDHLAAELEAAVERLMDMAKTQMQIGLKPPRMPGAS